MIVQVDDVSIKSWRQLRVVISQMLPGSQVVVTLIRDGKKLNLEVTLGSLDDPMAYNGTVNSQLLEGVSIQSLDDALREQFAIPANIKGVVLTAVSNDSPYANKLFEGLVITQVNRSKIASLKEFMRAIEEGPNSLYCWYRGKKTFIGLRVRAK